MQAFADIDERALAGTIAIVDVDGTLTNDKARTLDPRVTQKLRRLSEVAEVHLFSNGLPERTRMLANENGLHFLDSPHRKPNRRVIEGLERGGKQLVVIGDKALTDGLFAANIGAHYVPVQRLRHADDTFFARMIYALDDIAGYGVRAVFPALPYVMLLRPTQWVKNVLVFAPLFFAGEISDPHKLARAALAALIFCAVSSAMYIYNDIHDVESDRKHPSKRSRPIASGVISVSQAWYVFWTLALVSVAALATLPALALVMSAYVIGNILYTVALKRVAIVDIAVVAAFYLLRIVAGGVATETYLSPWIVLCVLFGALFLVIGKRRAEFAHASKRAVLESYSRTALDYLLAASATLAITSYGLYSVLGTRAPYAVYSTIFVFVAIFRLLNRMYLSDSGAEYPESLVFKDPWVLAMGFLWACYMFCLFYVA